MPLELRGGAFFSSRSPSNLAPDSSRSSHNRFVEAAVRLKTARTKNEGTDMCRLPPNDQSSRMDFAVHLGLGLAALLAVVISLGATFDFCGRLDQIAEALTSDRSS